MMKNTVAWIAFFLLTTLGKQLAFAQATLDVESGFVFTGMNDVRIPGNNGTLFSLKNDLSPETPVFYRATMSYTIGNRHTFAVLFAPLKVLSEGKINKEIKYQGVNFPAASFVRASYVFNSYRLTYRYDLVKNTGFEFGLGFTAKIRDAAISLTSDALQAEKTNVGFVPIIHFRLLWNINEKLGLLLVGDALAAPQGRAEDVLLAISCKLSDALTIRSGYRILEGGADNNEVYNFSLFNYATVGLSYTFIKRSTKL